MLTMRMELNPIIPRTTEVGSGTALKEVLASAWNITFAAKGNNPVASKEPPLFVPIEAVVAPAWLLKKMAEGSTWRNGRLFEVLVLLNRTMFAGRAVKKSGLAVVV